MEKRKEQKVNIGRLAAHAAVALVICGLIHLLAVGCTQLLMPTLVITRASSWFYWGIEATLMILTVIIALYSYKEGYFTKTTTVICTMLAWLPTIVWLVTCGISICNGVNTAKDKYNYVAELVTVVDTKKATADEIEEMEKLMYPDLAADGVENLPLYGIPEANNKAQALLATKPGLASQVQLQDKEWTTQSVNGSITYVNVLEPISMFRWDKEVGNSGYFTVDRNTGAAQHIETSMMHTLDAPFGRNVRRVMYNQLKPGEILSEITPEVDDNYVAHYVGSVLKKDELGGLEKVTAVMIMNPFTGEVTRYTLEEVPEWVDRVYPEDLFQKYISIYGEYANGFWNTVFGKKNIQIPTSDFDICYINSGCYAYTGWTTLKNGASSENVNGEIMMNLRSGEISLYLNGGISEEKAQTVAKGKVQDKGYDFSYPILLSLNGEPTYFMLMRDDNNNLVGYAFVSYLDYTKVGVAETIKEAQTLYYKSLATTNSSSSLDSSKVETVTGTITAIGIEVVEGNTVYYIRVEGCDKTFMLTSKLTIEIVFAELGDVYEISYIPADTEVISAVAASAK